MTTVSSRLRTVIYNPLSYIHTQRLMLPAQLQKSAQLALINRILIDHYQLSCVTPDVKPGSLDQLLLNNWSELPYAAYLLACHQQRNSLARAGRLLRLPAWARSFALLPLSERLFPAENNDVRSCEHAFLMQAGLQSLALLCEPASIALQQRIPLLFASSPIAPAITATRAHFSLLLIALQHVKKNSGHIYFPDPRRSIDQRKSTHPDTTPSGDPVGSAQFS
ncbi:MULTISPECIES: type III secretion apparatus protein OrgA/MxiK [unclassified Undibacterium]|uniref:type III secretion apparatus protein OrgA/MxiK n=1 Tax=unclassified Undibacterium TaxID=2630295 RepID=UPI002AC96A5A|nr:MULTISPECIES: type III secretion apparatus protein OrgA/MxiK [unclassified Undibacterium]MEB0140402.1 type III secretion apparatus protein OrgA/MxiK [Undibacterium sp. CCC2.1]MEB0173436.1 type III secretion apparatus protein OrgA/MxiK [Undibacterium sp. CCC1.1]MEB0177336.1 type III secretion apparatus protein OrgA/MxiK [Undibacterium sp. CCC3.4]MEB0216593.1 type III secretion apparatus protein OrgA/MxiK [Undibacterium sp. 5I2]WPX43495.1 type III secretion apparatus protein OrgA/MxiK [Undiba